jgi:hypothetical protein
MARGKIAPADSERMEALDWILSRLNAHGAGIVVRSKEQQDEADRRLHSAASMHDWHLAVRALDDGADVHSVVNGDTLRARLDRLKTQFEEKKDRMPGWRYNSERAGLKSIIIGLRNQGADVPELGPWLDKQPPFAGKERNAEMHLHAAVETLDFTWVDKLLRQGADKNSKVAGLTLPERLNEMAAKLENTKGGMSRFNYENKKKGIGEMALLLCLDGAGP